MTIKMTDAEAQIERESVEQVFGLTGGELNDRPWNGWAYNYDGVPEYATHDFDIHDSTYVTTLDIGCSYGTRSIMGERVTGADGRVWEVVAIYGSSGETECPNEDRAAECPLCGARAGEKHGVIYIGDSAEVVWQLIDDREEIMRRATELDDGERPSSLCDALSAIVGHGFSDDDSVGDCSTVGVVYDRIGRFLLKTTDRGFRTDLEFDSIEEAKAEMEALRADLEPADT